MFTMPKAVLIALKERYVTDAKGLTEQEQQIARRIQTCCNCGNVWLGHRKGPPQRCPECKKWRFNTPHLDQLIRDHQNTSLQTTPEAS